MKPIRLLGSIQIPISSSGWRVANAQFLLSEIRSRNLLGLDLQEQLGVVTRQLKAETIQSLEYGSSDPISEYWSSFSQRNMPMCLVVWVDQRVIKYIPISSFF